MIRETLSEWFLECFFQFSLSLILSRDCLKWWLLPHSSWSSLPQVAWFTPTSPPPHFSIPPLFFFSLDISIICVPPFIFSLPCYYFRVNHYHHSNCVFLYLFWREPSHLLNHFVKFVSSDNLHWVSPYLVKSKIIIQVKSFKLCNFKINSHHLLHLQSL